MMVRMKLLHIFKQKICLPDKKERRQEFEEKIFKLECKTYGFDCSFISAGKIEKIINEFRGHTFQEHYIDYPEGVLMRFITRKYQHL
jgi:hypothetical protein